MKILYVIEAPGQGTGRHVVDLAEALRDRGHEIHIVFSTRRISRDFLAELRALDGVRIHDIPMERSIGISDISATHALNAYVQSNGPFDIIHGHSSKGGALARLVSANAPTVCIYTPHCFATMDPCLSRARRLLFGRLERVLSWMTDGVIVVSPEERTEAAALGIARHKIFVVPHGIKSVSVEPRVVARARLGLCEAEVCIGFVGRLEAQKAPERALRAFVGVQRYHPHARLVMVGAGGMRCQLQREAMELGIADKVIWTGEIPSLRVFSAFDLLVLPSRYEGFSYTALEATFLGIPLVVSDAAGMSQVVEQGCNGIILEQGDEGTFEIRLRDAINRLVGNPGLRAAMSRESTCRREAFAIERMIEQTLLIYQTLRHRRRVHDREETARNRATQSSSRARDSWHPTLSDYARLSDRRTRKATAESGLVSVITVTKNAGRSLGRAIASIQRQSYPAVEHIIVDAGSTDETPTVARSKLRSHDYWLSEPDLGISDAFNKGIAVARGQYIQLMGADDWLSTDQIAVAVEALTKTGADFVFGDGVAYDGRRPVFRYHGDPNYSSKIDRWMPVIIHPSVLARRTVYETHGLFNIGLRSAMDYEWLLRVHRAGIIGIHALGVLSHVSLGGTHLQHYRRTMREVRDTAIAFGRDPGAAYLEYGYHCIKHLAAGPLQKWASPFYQGVRSWLNPAFVPVSNADYSLFAGTIERHHEPFDGPSR